MRLTVKYNRFSALILLACLTSSVANYSASTEQRSAGITTSPAYSNSASLSTNATLNDARTKIRHIVMIMQENRSFDHYFGTYPGADGIPMQNGVPTVCAPNPTTNQCISPFHDPNDSNPAGPHGASHAIADIDAGKMDGFVEQATEGLESHCEIFSVDPACGGADPHQPESVMGYHDAREIPNYWTYAQDFVLQDHMFEPNASWSLPAHLFTVSAWSAKCSKADDPMSCQSELQKPDRIIFSPKKMKERTIAAAGSQPDYAWTDLTYLLYNNNVSWAYYLEQGAQPDCDDDEMFCAPKLQNAKVPGIWNPLPYFDTVKQDGQLDNIQDVSNFYEAAEKGSLPEVSWIVPNEKDSEHFPALVSEGQTYVTSLINAIMQGPDWDTTAIFLAWDDWGGFYDHVVPPEIDENGYGLRVPSLVISPYAKEGYIDHQTLSFDAYLKLVEDIFLNGQRIDPETDGRPDPRPTVRENVPELGDLLEDFDFSQAPRPPVLLPTHPTSEGEPSGGPPPSDGLATGITYVVQPGDTLSEIAERTGYSIEAMVRANNIADPNLIFAGQILDVPSTGYAVP
jgi:phospholipase C